MSMAKRIYVCILLLGVLMTATGGTLLTLRAIEKAQYTKTTVVDDVRIDGIDVDSLPDDYGSTSQSLPGADASDSSFTEGEGENGE